MGTIKVVGAVSSLLVSSQCTTTQDQKATNPCMALYQEKASLQFYGYGEGYSQEAAVEQARGDLARQITTRVTSETTIEESNIDIEMTSLTSSKTDRVFHGMTVVQRCDAGQKKAAVVHLDKKMFIKSLKESLTEKLKEGQLKLSRATKAMTTGKKFRATGQLKQWYIPQEKSLDADIAICKAFASCSGSRYKLPTEIRMWLTKNEIDHVWTYKEDNLLAGKLKDEMVEMLQKEGIVIGDSKNSLMKVNCVQKTFPVMQGTGNRIVEINCDANGMIENEQVLSISYEAKGMGETIEDAFVFARTQLKKAN